MYYFQLLNAAVAPAVCAPEITAFKFHTLLDIWLKVILTSLSYPDCVFYLHFWLWLSDCVFQEKAIPRLLRLKQANDPDLNAAVREALVLLGYHAPVKGRGIRILSIDGGGLRYNANSSFIVG